MVSMLKPLESTSGSPRPLRESLEQAREDARRTPWRVVAWYATFGVTWIVVSDVAVSVLLGPSADAAIAQTGKGLAFIGLSGALMYAVTTRAHSRLSLTLQRAEHAEGLFLEAQRTETLTASVAEIVHDFRNNLAVVSGYADLALCSVEDGNELGDYVSHIQHAARNAHTLSAQLLALASGHDIDGADTTQRLTDAGTVLSRVGDVVDHLSGSAITVVVVNETGPCPVPLTAHALEQVLMNLAINARDAMPDGGTLTMRADRGTAASGGSSIVTVTVTDTGTGIENETLTRMWDPYFTTKPTGKGTGLGLPAVRVIVEQAGGSISATSTPGEGSVFRIELPSRTDGDTARAAAPAPTAVRRAVPVRHASPVSGHPAPR